MCKVARSDGCKLSATSPSSTTSQLILVRTTLLDVGDDSKGPRPANPIQSKKGMCDGVRLAKHATQMILACLLQDGQLFILSIHDSMTVHPATHNSRSSQALRGGSCFRRKPHSELHTPATGSGSFSQGPLSNLSRRMHQPSANDPSVQTKDALAGTLSLSLNFRASMIDVPFHFFCLGAGQDRIVTQQYWHFLAHVAEDMGSRQTLHQLLTTPKTGKHSHMRSLEC